MRIRGEIKRVGVFSKTQELEFEHASDSRGFRSELGARESRQRTRGLLSIKCAKNEIENPLRKAQNQGIESNQKPRGHEEDRASFPNQIPYKVSTIHGQNQIKREEQREGDTGAAAWRTEVSTNRLQKPLSNLTQVKGYLYPRDRSDRYAGPVRPVPETGWPAAPPVHDLI